MTSDVKTTKSNKWVEHIKDYASKNGMSYREAMRNEGCKSAYKMPIPELTRSPSPPPSPEPSPEPLETKEAETPVLKKEKKIRKKREPKMVPT